jgi:hypothetical protein
LNGFCSLKSVLKSCVGPDILPHQHFLLKHNVYTWPLRRYFSCTVKNLGEYWWTK